MAKLELQGVPVIILLFFGGQRKRSKRKPTRKFGLRRPSLTHLPAAGIKTRFAQTVYSLFPHSIASLGCILKGENKDF